MRDMYETRHAILSANSSNPLCAGDMYVVELEVSERMVSLGTLRESIKKQSLCLKVFSDEIIDDVRVPHTFHDLLLVADVEFERNNLTKVSARSEMPYGVLISIWEDYLRSDLGYSGDLARAVTSGPLRTNFRDEVTTKEAGGTKDGCYMTCNCAAAWRTKGNDSLSRGKDCYIV